MERDKHPSKDGAVDLLFTFEETQALFSEADHALDIELKRKHPEMSYDMIARQYPDEWVGIVVTRIGKERPVEAGRLLVHSADPDRFDDDIAKIRSAHPGLRITELFTAD